MWCIELNSSAEMVNYRFAVFLLIREQFYYTCLSEPTRHCQCCCNGVFNIFEDYESFENGICVLIIDLLYENDIKYVIDVLQIVSCLTICCSASACPIDAN